VKKKKTLILVTATQFVLNWIEIFMYSLRRHNPEDAFHLVVMTFPSSFDAAGKLRLENLGAELFERAMDSLRIKRFAAEHGTNLNVYRIKHLGKMFLSDAYLRRCKAEDFSSILICDLDIVFQSPLSNVTEKILPDQILAAQEHPSLSSQPFLVHKLQRALGFSRFQGLLLDLDRHEVNFGFLGGEIESVKQFAMNMLSLINAPDLAPLLEAETGRSDAYHEQDFMRLYLQATGYRDVALAGPETVIHLCHMPGSRERSRPPVPKENLGPGHIYPCVFHFAGGVWPMFSELRQWLDGYDLHRASASVEEYIGDMEFAISPEGRCVKTTPGGCINPFQQAWHLFEQGQFETSRLLFHALYSNHPDNTDYLFGLALSQIGSGENKKGYKLLQRYLNVASVEASRWRISAEILERAGLYDEAIALWFDIAKRFPEQPTWIADILRLMKIQHRIPEARELFRRVTQDSPGALSIACMGECLELIGDNENARAIYQQALEAVPADVSIRIRFVALLRKQGLFDQAIAFCRDYFTQFGSNMALQLHLAVAYLETGDHEKFVCEYGPVFESRQDINPGLVKNYARSLVICGRKNQAAEVLKKLFQEFRSDLEVAPFDSGIRLRDADLFSEAAEMFDLEASRGGNEQAPLFAAGCLARLGAAIAGAQGLAYLIEARGRLLGLLDASPGDPDLLGALCDVTRDLQQFNEARSIAEKLRRVKPEAFEAKMERIKQVEKRLAKRKVDAR
jgi:tetratricopeptide (TPR) repeat protein